MEKERRRLPVITKVVLAVSIISGLLLCTVISLAGSYIFTKLFREHYDSTIASVAKVALAVIDGDSIETYRLTKEKDENYQTTNAILDDLVVQFDLNFLYVSYVSGSDYTHIEYIYDLIKHDSPWTPYPLGYEEDYFEKDFNASSKKVFEQGSSIVRHTLKARSGSHITAMLPVYDSSKKIVAVLGVEKSMQEYVDSRKTFTFVVLLVEFLSAIVFITVFSAVMNRRIISPITKIGKEASLFVTKGGKPSAELEQIPYNDEIGTLAKAISKMEVDIHNYINDLTNITAEKERIGTELKVATQIQSDMLPSVYPAFPDHSEFDLFATMSPAKEVGGDLFDYLILDKNRILFMVGDVSGKGVPAALFMVITKTLLVSHAVQGMSPSQIFEMTNNQLSQNNASSMFVTCWLGIFSLDTGELTYVNAGHPSPVLCRSEGKIDYVREKPDFVLAAMPGVKYTEHILKMSKGDSLFVYTDGVTEATDSQNQLFGEERLLDAVSKTSGMNALDSLKEVRRHVDAFVGEGEQFDDITMLNFILK